MRSEELNRRLSTISTVWSELERAHAGPADAAANAQQQLLLRYGRPVYHYLLAALRDPAAAEDLTQEFALSLVRGQFRRVDSSRGRFRDYVKTVLFHLVSKHRKGQKKHPAPLPADSPQLAALVAPGDDPDRQFYENWREELLARAWEALAEVHPTFYSVLRLRATHPKMASAELAQQLSQQLGKPHTADWVRQSLRRAREMYADLLVEEVARSLESPTVDQVRQELGELNLLDYCPAALGRYAGGQP
jgi:RNA polymerase sigma-70 factor (ECF subfamily)